MAVQASGKSLPRRKRAMWWPLLIWAIFAFGLHFAAPLLNAVNVLGFPLAYYIAAQGALIVFALLGFWAAAPWRQSAVARTGAVLAGMSSAGLWTSGALSVALVGALYAYGYDGLAFVLGLSGGFVLIACIVAPAFSAAEAATLADFLTKRTGSRVAATAATAMTLVCLILLMSAEFELVRRLIAPLFAGSDCGSGIIAVFAVSLVAIFVARVHDLAATRLQAASYLLVLCAVTVAAGAMSLIAFDIALPQLAYGLGLRDLAVLERSLILDGVSDPAIVRPFVKPNTSLSAENFMALSLSLMLGVAAMPHMLNRFASAGPDPAPRQANAWALFFVVLLLITLPAIAVFAKFDVYTAIAKGITIDTVPAWLDEQTHSASRAVCAQGCADPGGRLHVEDITVGPEAILPSAPLIARMPGYAAWLFAALLALAATLSAGRVIAAMTRMLGCAPAPLRSTEGTHALPVDRVVSFTVTIGLAVAASVITMRLQADLMTRISWSVSLAASGLFPMLLLAAVWPRASSVGLALGGLAGFAAALYYIIGSQAFPLQFLDLWHAYSNMPPWRFEVLEEVRQNCRDAVAGACGEAEVMARELANWWGIDTRAAGVIGAPVGFIIAALLSLPKALRLRARA